MMGRRRCYWKVLYFFDMGFPPLKKMSILDVLGLIVSGSYGGISIELKLNRTHG